MPIRSRPSFASPRRILLALAILGASAGCRADEPELRADSNAAPVRAEAYCAQMEQWATEGAIEQTDCGVSRGPKTDKKIALVFTAGYFCEGGPTILDALRDHGAKASFFLLSAAVHSDDPTSKCQEVVPRLLREGHYVGPHSDTHPDLVDGQGGRTIVARQRLDEELHRNVDVLRGMGVTGPMQYWMPPSETFNAEIAAWSAADGVRTVHLAECPRTRGDYLPVDANGGIFSNPAMMARIFDCEARDPNGFRGALLFFHLGIGPDRAEPDKFHNVFPEMMRRLADLGYGFVRIDELLDPVFARASDAGR